MILHQFEQLVPRLLARVTFFVRAKKVTKETRPGSLTLRVPSLLVLCEAAAELAIKSMAQTVLAENPTQIIRSSVSSMGSKNQNLTELSF